MRKAEKDMWWNGIVENSHQKTFLFASSVHRIFTFSFSPVSLSLRYLSLSHVVVTASFFLAHGTKLSLSLIAQHSLCFDKWNFSCVVLLIVALLAFTTFQFYVICIHERLYRTCAFQCKLPKKISFRSQTILLHTSGGPSTDTRTSVHSSTLKSFSYAVRFTLMIYSNFLFNESPSPNRFEHGGSCTFLFTKAWRCTYIWLLEKCILLVCYKFFDWSFFFRLKIFRWNPFRLVSSLKNVEYFSPLENF